METRHAGAPAGLLLAAGEGRRLGTPKALVEIGGIRLTDRGVRMLHEAGCTPIIVVTIQTFPYAMEQILTNAALANRESGKRPPVHSSNR